MTERNIRKTEYVGRDLGRGIRTPRIIPAGDRNEETKRKENRERVMRGQQVTVPDLIQNIEVNVDRARGRRTRGRGRKIHPKE